MTIKDLYLCIREQIECNTPIKHVRLFNNQFNRDSQEHAFPYPNAFIEFNRIEWEGQPGGQQTAQVEIIIHQGFNSLKDEDIGMYDTVQLTYLALQGFQGAFFTRLNRIEEVQDTDHDGVTVWQTRYITGITDQSANDNRNRTPHTIQELRLLKDIDIDSEVLGTGDGDFNT